MVCDCGTPWTFTSFFYSTDRSNAVVPVSVLLFVALWFILRGGLFYVLPCVILFLCSSVLLALQLPRLGKRELILVLFVRLFDLCLFGFVGFPLPLGAWEGLRFVIVSLPGLFSYLGFILLTGAPGVSLTLCFFVVYSTRRFVLCLTLCYFVLVFFSPFSIAIISLGEEIASPSAFHAFVRFTHVWFCLLPLPLGVWDRLRFVIVALPVLFFYPSISLSLASPLSIGSFALRSLIQLWSYAKKTSKISKANIFCAIKYMYMFIFLYVDMKKK